MNSIQRMREAVFFEGTERAHRASRFWMLLVLASVIASAGVVADSTATVIGAMIVAPLMTPILGVVLATVLGDRTNLWRSWSLVVGGAAAAVAIGYLVGLLVPSPVIAATNTQVAGRISPDLIDLLAALATGVVGAVALVREDISDTLPGVAIAISLVPPLAVVGLTLQSEAWSQSLGALLLFATNVAAILATGVIVLIITGFARNPATSAARPRPTRRVHPLVTILVTLAVIGIPLAGSSIRFTQQTLLETTIREAAQPWADEQGWEIVGLRIDGEAAVLKLTGAPPVPPTRGLVDALEAAGVEPTTVTAEFIPAYEVNLGSDR